MSDGPSRQRLSALSDDQLVERVRSGSEAAVEKLFARHQLPLLAFCRHMLGRRDRGEAAVRESFAQALGTVRMHDRPVHLKALLFAIARNRCLVMLDRMPQRAGDVELHGLDAEVARDPELRALVGVVGSLPSDQRAALLLAQLGRHAEEEIATIVGAPKDKVAALVGQARMAVAGLEKPADWHCAQAVAELAGNEGHPRREATRRHIADCDACAAFPATLAHQRRLLEIVLPVAPSDRLSAPAPAAATGRARVRPHPAPEAPGRRGLSRTTLGLAAAGALLVGAAGVGMSAGGGSTPGPGALAPAAAGGGQAGGGGGHRGADEGAGAVGRVSGSESSTGEDGGHGVLTRAAIQAQRLVSGP
jgi:DNA-directed RNA polymerase specialized sigma24 family protein